MWRAKMTEQTAVGQVAVKKQSRVPGVMITQFVENVPAGKSTPDFLLKPIALTIQEGKTAVFKAVVSGNPKPEVIWKRAKGEMTDNQKFCNTYDASADEYILEIACVSGKDGDIYKCFAVNEFGKAVCTAALNVIEVGFKREKAMEGPADPAEFRKLLRKSAGRVQEEKEPPKKEGEVDDRFWELLLSAEKKDYERICAEFGVTDFRWMLKKLNIMKREREEEINLYVNVLSSLRHIEIKGEGSATFELDLDLKDPHSRIFLYKVRRETANRKYEDGVMIQYSRDMEMKHQLRTVGKKLIFTIKDLVPEDAGVYQVDVEDVNIFTTEFRIPNVDFVVKIQEVKAREREDAIFECVLSRPFSKIHWTGKNSQLENGDKYEITVSADKLIHRLRVKDCKQVDKGIYTASAGIKACSAWLTVEAETELEKKKVRKTTQAGGAGVDLGKVAQEQAAKLQKEKVDKREAMKKETEVIKQCVKDGKDDGNAANGLDGFNLRFGNDGSGLGNVSGSDVDSGEMRSTGTDCKSVESGLSGGELAAKNVTHTDKGSGDDKSGNIERSPVHPGPEVQVISSLSTENAKVGLPDENCNGSWSKDGKKIDDAGKCSFEKEVHRPETMLAIEGPRVQVLSGLSDMNAKAGQPAELVCKLSKENCDGSWSKDGKKLSPRDGLSLSKDGAFHKLKISSCQTDDTGKYSFEAGGHKTEAMLTVEGPEVQFISGLSDMNVKLGQPAELVCKLSKENCSGSWSKDGKELLPRDGLKISNDGTFHKLKIDSCKADDSGKYSFKAGGHKTEATLTVEGPEVQILSGLSDMNAKMGHPAELVCKLSKDNCDGSWSKDGKKLSPRDGLSLSKDGALHKLKISSCQEDDSGKYCFEAEGRKTKAIITVEGAEAQVLSGLSDIKVKVGQPAELVCKLSKENCNGSWSKDGKKLSSRDGLTVSNDGVYHKLKIKSCCADDAGKYSFEADGRKTEAIITVEGSEVQVLSGLSDMNAKAGQPAELVCKLSKDNCDGSWSKDGEKLSSGDGLTLSKDGASHKLKISSCQPNDTGKYSFEAEGCKTEAMIVVKDPEVRILSGLSDVNAKVGQPAELVCKLSKENYNGAWRRDGKRLLPRHGLSLSKDGLYQKLKIDSCCVDDTGIYCFEAEGHKTEAVIIVEDPGAHFIRGLHDLDVKAGQSAELVVKLNKEDCSGSWFKDGSKLSPRDGLSLSNDGVFHKLKISSCQADDSGKYSFEADGHKSEAKVTVQGPEIQVISGLSSINVKVGQPAELVCKLNDENCSGVWFKDGNKLLPRDGMTLSKDGACHKLKIDNCCVGDAGKYRFESEGRKTEATITVEDPPRFDKDDLANFCKPVIVRAGQNAIFKMPFAGDEHTKVQWYKEDEELQDKPNVKLEKTPSHTRLLLSSCQRKDSGEIKVKVKNDFGTIEAVSQLTVIDKPSAPQGPLEVVENSASCIYIKWRPPKDDGGSQLVGYALERQQVGRNTWMKLGPIESAAAAYKDTSVEHGRKYCYRIRAVNEEGLGDPLETEGIKAGIKAYPGPPAPPKVVSAFSDCINLTWTAPTNTGGSQILGYSLEKRKKGSNMWSPINPQDEPIKAKQYAVKDIIQGMEYEFRVSAINVSGVGEPSIPSDLVAAKDPKKPPGKVIDLKVTDSSYTTLSLAWTKPNVEEGVQDEAKGYFVEIRPAESQEWTRCNTNPIIQTTFTVKGLKSMDIYWVRVIAVNSGGEGAPQDLDNYITAMPPPVRPKFTDTKMKTFMVVRAGNAVRINVNFQASPWPEVVWLRDGMTLPKHVTISNTEGMSQLLIPTSERSDSGVYSIIIKNLVGQETLSVEIRVTDDPKPPGPVELEENVPGTVTVRWEPSEDEKCDDRLHYLVSKRDSSKQTWHTVADRLFNNQFTACNIVPGHEYRFRIYAKNDIGMSDFSESPTWGTTRKKEKFVVSMPEYRPCNLESAPAFLVPLKMHVAPKGYECYMNCAVTGNPQPHITWYHNNVSLNTNTNYYISNTSGVCSMLIMRVGADNRGEYTVMAENKLGKAECSTKLTVRE